MTHQTTGKKDKKSRDWVFTWHNYTDDDKNYIGELLHIKKPAVRYICYGEEICPKTGTPHLQGYVYFHNEALWSTVCRLLKQHWCDAATDGYKASFKYTSKTRKQDLKPNEVFIEHGERPEQGKRNDMTACKEMIDEGATDKDLYDAYFGTASRYMRSFRDYRRCSSAVRQEPPRVWWLYGKTGTGKSGWPTYMHGRDNIYIKDNTKWWDGYNAQQAILIDDFDETWETKNLLRLLDRYAYSGETKGGHVNINSPCIYITCDRQPCEIWRDINLSQVLRRLDKLYHITLEGPEEMELPAKGNLPWFLKNAEVTLATETQKCSSVI